MNDDAAPGHGSGAGRRGPVRAVGIAATTASLLAIGLASLGAPSAAMVVVLVAGAAFALANYASYRLGYDFVIAPGISARIFFGALMLAVVAALAGLGY